MKKIITIVSVIMMTGTAIAQWWPTGTLLNSGGNFLGTSAIYNAPINIFTNGINRAQFTTGNALTSLVG
ncbi:MAG: hypothetical protein M9916_05950, partial [Crocinitomicaceae bacterium]|nr:hypothetical protein [Crocinitomicaceae bacterium]